MHNAVMQGWVKPNNKELKHKLKPLKFCQAQVWIGLKFKLKPLVKKFKSELKPFLWTIGITIRSAADDAGMVYFINWKYSKWA